MKEQFTYSLSQLKSLTFPPESSIIGNGLLRKGSILCIAGPPKSYKSFMLNTMVMQCLVGGHLFNVWSNHARVRQNHFPITPIKKVLVFEQEVGPEDMRERWLNCCRSFSPSEQSIIEQGLHLHSCDFRIRLNEAEGINALRAVITVTKPDLICLDPLIKFHTNEENDPSEMNRVMLELRKLAWELNLTVAMSHHTGKSEEREGLDRLRGASSIAGDLDTGLLLHVINRSAATVMVEPVLRRGKPIRPFNVQLNEDTLRMEFIGWSNKKDRKSEEFDQLNAQTNASKMTQ